MVTSEERMAIMELATLEQRSSEIGLAVVQLKWTSIKQFGVNYFRRWLSKNAFNQVGHTCKSTDCPLHRYMWEVFGLWADINDSEIGLYNGEPVWAGGEYSPSPISVVTAPDWMIISQKKIDGFRKLAIHSAISGGEAFYALEDEDI